MNDSIGAAFSRIAARLSDKAAIVCDGSIVSYKALDRASDAIARRLLAGRAGPPGRVAMLFSDRSMSIIAMLGVLKAGDAYVPLDADDPDERVGFVLRDCEPVALLTSDAHVERARSLLKDGCLLHNIEQPVPTDTNIALPDVAPEALAYLFYTSGTTGKPKGVCHTHKNLLYFIRRYSESIGIRQDDRLSLLYSLSFSAANMDIYGGLLNGASVHAYDVRKHGIAPLADWLEKEAITILHTVPTVFRHLTSSLEPTHRFAQVRAIDLGGETAFGSDVKLFRRHFRADCRFVNRLAATEVMMIAQYAIAPEQTDDVQVLPVGRSPDGVHLRIQRADGSEADPGEVGEIVVSSPFVSTGYWRQPELNAGVFFQDRERPGSRLYRTGDLGTIAADGNLHFLGRNGTRVKIRGQSVDLNEVEAGLRRCACVRDAAVTVVSQSDRQEADKLLAYVVADSTPGQGPSQIRRELAKWLPRYMLPSGYVFLDALPLTATGKIDRNALPKPSELPACREGDYQPPQDSLESEIAEIYAQILKYAPVGRNDDFFLSGGDSLSVMELKLMLADLFGHNDVNVLEDATVAGVARLNRHLLSVTSSDEQLMPVLVPLRKEGSGPALFLVHGRHGQAHVSPYFLSLVGQDQAVYGFQARGVDGIQTPHETISAMAQDYVAEMRRVQPHGPYFIGGFCAGGYVTIEMARILKAAGEQLFPLLLIDPPLPFFSPNAVKVQLQTLAKRIHKHSAKGNIDFDVGDSNRWEGAARTVTSFENALLNYKPVPYDGPAFLLTNTTRLKSAHGWQSSATLNRVFSGVVHCFEVGESHGEILDVRNHGFVNSLRRCVQTVRGQALETTRQ